MKEVIILFMLPFVISGCLSITQKTRTLKTTPVKKVELKESETEFEQKQFLQFKNLDGFFLKNSIKLPNDINFFTANSINKFKSLLGIAKTMSITIAIPNFSESILLIIVGKPSIATHNIIVNQVYMKDDNMYAEYEIKEQGSDKGYFTQNLGVFDIKRPAVILNVYFVDKNNKAFVIPFGNRHDNSPSNIQDMLKNYTGVYKGIFPASDNNKILTELELNPDYSYTLRQKYLNNNGRTFESPGKWYPSIDISSFILNKNKDLIFFFVNKNTIEKLSTTGERLESGEYVLKK